VTPSVFIADCITSARRVHRRAHRQDADPRDGAPMRHAVRLLLDIHDAELARAVRALVALAR